MNEIIKEEILREYLNEQRDAEFDIWKEEQKEYLVYEFAELFKDDFDAYCRQEFKSYLEDY